MLRLLDDSDSRRTIENMLKMYYEPLEAWYLRSSIEKVRLMSVLLVFHLVLIQGLETCACRRTRWIPPISRRNRKYHLQ